MPRFNFCGSFMDKDSDLSIANFQFFSVVPENYDFFKKFSGF